MTTPQKLLLLEREIRAALGTEWETRVPPFIVEEIAKYVEADSLAYLSLPGLLDAVSAKNNEFCTACYTGSYPIEFIDVAIDPRAAQRQMELWEASLTDN